MSYQPLHHKYRPQTFKDLVGQEAITKTLTNAMVTQRIAPAYLFTGPRGTGKTSSARILAKSLNCLSSEQPTPKPCGLCEVCREIARGYALDVTEIDAASNTGVDNIREIIEKTQFAPARCRYKVYIIDEVHMLSTAAFNALLKTLEEPPARVVFVLATTDPQRVLPTIISRCQRFDFRRIPLEGMVAHLQTIASQENIDITSEAITLVAQVAQGGLRDAESLLDQLSLLTGQVTVEAVWDLVGAVPERDLLALTEAITADNPEVVFEQCRRLMDKGREPLVVLQNLAGFYRDLLIARTAQSRSDLVAITSETWNQLCELSQRLEVGTILQGQQHLKNSEVQIKNTTQPRLWLEVTLLGLLPSANRQKTGELNPNKIETKIHQGAATSTIDKANLSNQERSNTNSAVSPQSHSNRTQTISPQTSETKGQQPSAPRINYSNNGAFPPATSAQTSHLSSAETPIAVSPNPENITSEKVVNTQSATLEQIWQQVIEHLRLPSIKALFEQHCYLLSFEGTVACVGVNSQPLLNLAQERLSSLEVAFEAVYQSKIKVKLLSKTGKSQRNYSTKISKYSNQFVEPEPQPRVTQLGNHLQKIAKPIPSEIQERKGETEEDSTHIGTPNFPQAQVSLSVHQSPSNSSSSSVEELTPNHELEWETEDVEKAMEDLKQFFDGEIIEITNDWSKPKSSVSEQAQIPEVTQLANSQLEANTEISNEGQDLELLMTTQTQELVEITAQDKLRIQEELEDSQATDDDVPF